MTTITEIAETQHAADPTCDLDDITGCLEMAIEDLGITVTDGTVTTEDAERINEWFANI